MTEKNLLITAKIFGLMENGAVKKDLPMTQIIKENIIW